MPTTLVTWNLKGSGGPDVAAVADHLRSQRADIVALQEVQWHQARRIARALGARGHRWGFKHWPVRTWPEGMAIIGVTREVSVHSRALSHGWRPWSWRRRIVQVATVDGGERPDPGAGDALTLVNVHLTPRGQVGMREVETATVLAIVARHDGAVVVCGDFNERPGGPIHRQLAGAGLRDGWAEPRAGVHAPDESRDSAPRRAPDPWPTNWRAWRRGTPKAPTQQLDYVYVSAAIGAIEVVAPRPGDEGFERFAALSDHLPVTAVFVEGPEGCGVG